MSFFSFLTAEQLEALRFYVLMYMCSTFLWMCYMVSREWPSPSPPSTNKEDEQPTRDSKDPAIPSVPIKYEQKYLEKYRELAKTWSLTAAQQQWIEHRTNTLFEAESKLLQEQKTEAEDPSLFLETPSSSDEDEFCKIPRASLTIGLSFTPEEEQLLRQKCQVTARQEQLKQLEEALQNNFVMDYTPLGNVIMSYDAKRESFTYYSNSTIPYRYLEPVCRKYVTTFRAPWLYVDMEEELRLAEERWDKEAAAKKPPPSTEEKPEEKKKSVFAKFKSYNQQVGSGSSQRIPAPPKTNQIMRMLTPEQEQEKILLKSRATRFTHGGNICNFSFTKKVQRKAVVKRLSLTYEDYKKQFHAQKDSFQGVLQTKKESF